MKKTKKYYLDKLYNLRAIGVKLKIDARKKLTTAEKSAISRTYSKFEGFVESPEENYVSRVVAKNKISGLKHAGYSTFGNRVFIPKTTDSTTIRVRKGKIIETFRNGKRIITPILKRKETILDQLERLATQKLPPGMYATVSLGGEQWNTRFTYDFRTMFNYLRAWMPKGEDDKWTRKNLIANMSLIITNRSKADEPRKKQRRKNLGKRVR